MLPIQAESPDSAAIASLHFDYERLETLDPTTTKTNDNGPPQTDDPDRLRPETQNKPDGGTGKRWTIIMESTMIEDAIKLRKLMEQKEAALKAELEEEKEKRKQVEQDNDNQMKSLWDALREAQELTDYKFKAAVKQLPQVQLQEAPMTNKLQSVMLIVNKLDIPNKEEDVWWQTGQDPWTQELQTKMNQWVEKISNGVIKIPK